MNPSDAQSSLAALRQLQELLDAGTITPTEFEALKRQLIFGAAPGTGPTPEMPLTEPAPLSDDVQLQAELSSPEPDWLAAVAPSLLIAEATPTPPPPAERRNSLNVIFIVGGILVLLALVAYLTLDSQPPSEHLTSASRTAADSVAAVPEVGPQAEQITLPPAAVPETVRVAPVVRPVVPVAPAPGPADSVEIAPTRPAPAVPVPAPTPAKPAAAPAKAAPVAAPAATDSVGRP